MVRRVATARGALLKANTGSPLVPQLQGVNAGEGGVWESYRVMGIGFVACGRRLIHNSDTFELVISSNKHATAATRNTRAC